MYTIKLKRAKKNTQRKIRSDKFIKEKLKFPGNHKKITKYDYLSVANSSKQNTKFLKKRKDSKPPSERYGKNKNLRL